jgi:hypothetical protein
MKLTSSQQGHVNILVGGPQQADAVQVYQNHRAELFELFEEVNRKPITTTGPKYARWLEVSGMALDKVQALITSTPQLAVVDAVQSLLQDELDPVVIEALTLRLQQVEIWANVAYCSPPIPHHGAFLGHCSQVAAWIVSAAKDSLPAEVNALALSRALAVIRGNNRDQQARSIVKDSYTLLCDTRQRWLSKDNGRSLWIDWPKGGKRDLIKSIEDGNTHTKAQCKALIGDYPSKVIADIKRSAKPGVYRDAVIALLMTLK